MSSTIVIHVQRPYANEEEYLAGECFSIDAKSMLLIDQAALPAETPIVFDIQLENGQKPIRAEAKVIGHVAAAGDKRGGLRVRFKRFGAATKSFIDRAIALSAVAPAAEYSVSLRPAPAPVPQPGLVETEPVEVLLARAPIAGRAESSGVHCRPVVPVAAPVNREELLERLRTRSHTVGVQSNGNSSEQTG